MEVMVVDDYSSSRKDMMVKKAIRDYAKEHGIGINNYGSISTLDLLDYMKDNKMGVRWISKNGLSAIRKRLAKQYNEKIKE
jgi:hypothetical protein